MFQLTILQLAVEGECHVPCTTGCGGECDENGGWLMGGGTITCNGDAIWG